MAMDCQALNDPPRSIVLAGVDEVVIERGPERRVDRERTRLHVACPDRWMSRSHARFVRAGEQWLIEDGGSRNGTRLNTFAVTRKPVGNGDVVECGGTFFLIRRSVPPPSQSQPNGEKPAAMRTVNPALDLELSVMRKLARTPIPVLIMGESGTGKEGIASAIHTLSGRNGAFIAVNCGAIPVTLIESELFGTTRGAYSGAVDRLGMFRTADGGTLLLDEIGELPASSQAALLRVLQEREIVPLGSNRSVRVDVRVIAATNRPLEQLMAEGKFRADLYARLSAYELRMPPLRERREDLGILVADLVARHDRSGAARTISREAARALFAYDWPLNIRELEQCISAAVTIAESEIDLEHLRPPIRSAGQPQTVATTLDRDTIVATIRRQGGNMAAVARALEISRGHLYRILHRHSIRPSDLTPKD